MSSLPELSRPEFTPPTIGGGVFDAIPQTAVTNSNYLEVIRSIYDLRPSSQELRDSLQTEGAYQTVNSLADLTRLTVDCQGSNCYADAASRVCWATASIVVGEMGEDLVDFAARETDAPIVEAIEDMLAFNYASDSGTRTRPAVSEFVAASCGRALQRAGERSRARPRPDDYAQELEVQDYEEGMIYSRTLAGLLRVSQEDRAVASALKAALSEVELLSRTDAYVKNVLREVTRSDTNLTALYNLFGLPGEKVVAATQVGYRKGKSNLDIEDYTERCVSRVLSLERQEPGICRALYTTGRFRNFGRHSEEFLLNLYRQPRSGSGRSAYFLFSTADGDGSSTRNSAPKLERLAKELGDQGVEVYGGEFDSPDDLEYLGRVAEHLGISLASLLVVDSHSFANEMINLKRIRPADIQRSLGALTSKVTRDNALVFICACSTAQSDESGYGIAATLSDVANRDVIGSSFSFSLKSVTGSIGPDGTPNLDVVSGKPTSHVRTLQPQYVRQRAQARQIALQPAPRRTWRHPLRSLASILGLE